MDSRASLATISSDWQPLEGSMKTNHNYVYDVNAKSK